MINRINNKKYNKAKRTIQRSFKKVEDYQKPRILRMEEIDNG